MSAGPSPHSELAAIVRGALMSSPRFKQSHADALNELEEQYEDLKRLQASDSQRAYDLGNEAARLSEQLEAAQAALCEIAESSAVELADRPSLQHNGVVTVTPYEWARSRAAAALYPASGQVTSGNQTGTKLPAPDPASEPGVYGVDSEDEPAVSVQNYRNRIDAMTDTPNQDREGA